MLSETLLFALDGDGPPAEVRLFALGDNATQKGNFKLTGESLAAIIADFKGKGVDRLPFDYGHGMLNAVSADSHKAAGWFVPAARDDGLYATDIEWTEPARAALDAREYRFFSPAIKFDKSRTIQALTNVALTNLPATVGQEPLVLDGTGEQEKQNMNVLLSALKVEDEAEAVKALGALQDFGSTVLSAVGASSHGEALEKIETALKGAVDAQAELSALRAERAAEKRGVEIQALLDARKLAPAQKDFAASLTDELFSQFAESLSVLPIAKPVEEPKSVELDSKTPGADFDATEFLEA